METSRPAAVRSEPLCSCCSHLANSTKRTSQPTDTPTARSHWPAQSREAARRLAGTGVTSRERAVSLLGRRGDSPGKKRTDEFPLILQTLCLLLSQTGEFRTRTRTKSERLKTKWFMQSKMNLKVIRATIKKKKKK